MMKPDKPVPRCRNPMRDCPETPLAIYGNGYCGPCNYSCVPELVEALRPFAEMHRPGCNLDEIACERGTASDMTILSSRNFADAAAIVARADAGKEQANA